MTSISAQFRVFAKVDFENLMKSKVTVQMLHTKGWRPLFEFTAGDFFNKQKPAKAKRRMK